MKNIYSLISLLVLLIPCMALTSCDNDSKKTDDTPTLPLKASDIYVKKALLNINQKWLTEGDNYALQVENIDFSCQYEGVKLKSLRLERENNIIATANYTPNVSLSAKVSSWSHGTNTLTVIGIFSNDESEVAVEIAHPQVIVFNEAPHYTLGGNINTEITAFANNGERFYKYTNASSKTQLINLGSNISWSSSSGDCPDFYLKLSLFPTLTANFEGTIETKEIRWMNYENAPKEGYATSIPQKDFGNLNITAYVSLVITGVHENIELSESLIVTYEIQNTDI